MLCKLYLTFPSYYKITENIWVVIYLYDILSYIIQVKSVSDINIYSVKIIISMLIVVFMLPHCV